MDEELLLFISLNLQYIRMLWQLLHHLILILKLYFEYLDLM